MNFSKTVILLGLIITALTVVLAALVIGDKPAYVSVAEIKSVTKMCDQADGLDKVGRKEVSLFGTTLQKKVRATCLNGTEVILP